MLIALHGLIPSWAVPWLWGALALYLLAFVVPMLFYARLLHRAMDRVSQANRPFPGILAWVLFLPLIGWIWLFVFQIALSLAIRRDFEAAGRTDHEGAGLAYAILMAVFAFLHAIPVIQFGAVVANFILWTLLWSQFSRLAKKLPVLAPSLALRAP